LVIDVPETVLLAEKADEASFGRELKVLAAVKLYELGRLTSGRAAELAGMSRVEFLSNLGRYKVFPLEAELRDLGFREETETGLRALLGHGGFADHFPPSTS
jgi:predicted HTH domain antitoxin